MFKTVKAKSISEYLAKLMPERREILVKLEKIIQEAAPTLKPNFLYNMPGYGSFPYKNYRGENIQWPTIAIASQKNYISIYVCAVEKDGYLAEKYRDELGKVSVGKSCIRLKKLEDLNLETFIKLVKKAAMAPGLVQAR